MESITGLRERKKAATRQAVHEAALRLTVEHGIENVTVEAIADAAGISRRTFSNYFSSKEDALLFGEEQQTRALVETLRQRPPEESAWTALTSAARSLSMRMGTPEERAWGARSKLAMRHPSLLARQMGNHVALERDLVAAITGRPGTERIRPQVYAAAFLTALRIATRHWVEEGGSGELMDLLGEIEREMAQPFD
ncbi:TetR family transcriptional regulator [Streptomyces sp. 3MP-14]|uniref:TetR family transcriptional regulator n=1 Tax=Streptomyces mimosae TaxID=2586635 RepID=A0A5N6A099_9ACTN|nr:MULTISPECIES: TetR/AcrR family transcriptional regulator [Streptomyces]KAB8162177.1 TetR family transcriptional regulator [Streptomyces mimosae]KAB8173925.1 TetR family transcriptional regulator [Streptomyces sp. 3MP-14]